RRSRRRSANHIRVVNEIGRGPVHSACFPTRRTTTGDDAVAMTSRTRPSILFVSPAVPAAGGNGLAMRLGLFLEALVRVGDVQLVVLPVSGPPVASALCERLGVQPHFVPVSGRADTHFSLLAGLRDDRERLAAFADYGRPSLTAGL